MFLPYFKSVPDHTHTFSFQWWIYERQGFFHTKTACNFCAIFLCWQKRLKTSYKTTVSVLIFWACCDFFTLCQLKSAGLTSRNDATSWVKTYSLFFKGWKWRQCSLSFFVVVLLHQSQTSFLSILNYWNCILYAYSFAFSLKTSFLRSMFSFQTHCNGTFGTNIFLVDASVFKQII